MREGGKRVLHFHSVLFISPTQRCPAERRPTEQPRLTCAEMNDSLRDRSAFIRAWMVSGECGLRW